MSRVAFIYIVVMVFGGTGYSHSTRVHSKPVPKISNKAHSKTPDSINTLYQSNVKPIFKQKCFDCHSRYTRYPWYYSLPLIKTLIDHDIEEAHKHLDMSNDFPFKGHGTIEEDLNGIKKVVEEGSMPIWRYRLLHWGSTLTETDKKAILAWIQKAKMSVSSISGKETRMAFTMTSPAFHHEGKIPKMHTCQGADVSPELEWSGAPSGTKSFVLLTSAMQHPFNYG